MSGFHGASRIAEVWSIDVQPTELDFVVKSFCKLVWQFPEGPGKKPGAY